jgi:glutaredoxin-like protein
MGGRKGLMTEKLLNQEVIRQVQDAFAQLKEPVQVLFFGKKEDCDYCDDALTLVEEVVGLSDKLSLAVYDIDEDAETARQYKVDKAPGMVIAGLDGEQVLDYGIRLAGIPSGHEFSSLVHDLILVSGRDSGLNPKTRAYLSKLEKPVHLQVFVTPT